MTDLAPDQLMTLAPIELVNHRTDRFRGDNERAELGHFHPDDQKLLRSIYEELLIIFLELRPYYAHPGKNAEILAKHAQHCEALIEKAAHLGEKTETDDVNDPLRLVVHDLRGGAFQAFITRMQLLQINPLQLKGLPSLFFLLRDHLKIMRTCVGDLDPKQFEIDALHKDHGTALLVEKWSHADFHGVRRPVHIELDCSYHGTLCESCLEFSTLDRIIYNLINNAAAYAADDTVFFHILPLPDADDAQNIRFVVGNHVTPQHRQKVDGSISDLGELFHSGFTTGGHGMGIRIVADFCAQAYGIHDYEEAKAGGYFGAKWIEDEFVAWFHWPVAGH